MWWLYRQFLWQTVRLRRLAILQTDNTALLKITLAQ
jgi:hypothetical protein